MKKYKKILASICIICGVAILAIPFFYYYRGQEKTDALLASFDEMLEEETYEEKEKEEQGEQTSNSKEDTTLLGQANAIGIIEIKAIDIRLPIIEGADATSIDYAIGHLSETAEIGTDGNCVLAGHNGSRNGTFFTNLNQVVTSDVVKLIDSLGEVHRYEVSKMYVTEPYDQDVKVQGNEEILTLITCSEKGTKRLIVKCTPVKEGD